MIILPEIHHPTPVRIQLQPLPFILVVDYLLQVIPVGARRPSFSLKK